MSNKSSDLNISELTTDVVTQKLEIVEKDLNEIEKNKPGDIEQHGLMRKQKKLQEALALMNDKEALKKAEEMKRVPSGTTIELRTFPEMKSYPDGGKVVKTKHHKKPKNGKKTARRGRKKTAKRGKKTARRGRKKTARRGKKTARRGRKKTAKHGKKTARRGKKAKRRGTKKRK